MHLVDGIPGVDFLENGTLLLLDVKLEAQARQGGKNVREENAPIRLIVAPRLERHLDRYVGDFGPFAEGRVLLDEIAVLRQGQRRTGLDRNGLERGKQTNNTPAAFLFFSSSFFLPRSLSFSHLLYVPSGLPHHPNRGALDFQSLRGAHEQGVGRVDRRRGSRGSGGGGGGGEQSVMRRR